MVFVITSQSQNLKEREAEIVLFVLSPDTSQEPLLKVQATCSSCVHFTPEEAGVSAWWPGMKEPVCSQLVTQQADVTPGAVRAQEVRRPSKEPLFGPQLGAPAGLGLDWLQRSAPGRGRGQGRRTKGPASPSPRVCRCGRGCAAGGFPRPSGLGEWRWTPAGGGGDRLPMSRSWPRRRAPPVPW